MASTEGASPAKSNGEVTAAPACVLYDPTKPPYYLSDLLPYNNLKGLDFIMHNMYCYPDDHQPPRPCDCTKCAPEPLPYKEPPSPHQLTTFRKFFHDWTVDDVVRMVAEHVEKGFYRIISLNATEHAVVVVVATEKHWEDFGDGFCNET